MNPSQFPQVIRSRSRSPSPSFRYKVEKNDGDGRSRFLDVPDIDPHHDHSHTLRRSRSYTDYPSIHRSRRHRLNAGGMTAQWNSSLPFGFGNYGNHKHLLRRHRVQELENMASVETVGNTFHAINEGELDHSLPQNRGNQETWQVRSEGSPHRDYGSTTRSQSKRKCFYTPAMEDALRRRLKFFFMDPCSKFRARRHWPWKLSMQVLKIVIITVQIVIFGGQRSEVVEYFERNHIALQHLLLKDWSPSYETMPYPPASGVYAIYHKDDFFSSIDHAWKQYYSLQNISLTTLTLMRSNHTVDPMTMCWTHNNYVQFPNGTYVVGPGVLHNCTELVPVQSEMNEEEYNIKKFLENNNISIEFERLQELKLEFHFGLFHLNLIETHYGPTCYRVDAKIQYTNYERSGQVIVDLDTSMGEMECSGKIMSPQAEEEELSVKKRAVAFDVVVILICLMSSLLCSRSLIRAWNLKRTTEKFFRMRYGKTLDLSDRMEFVNLWYFLIVVNDVVTIIGSAFKIQLEIRKFSISSENYDLCSIMLGLGGLMAWIGCLRYLGFFKKYNILILTLKTAFPNVLRFSVCALALYFGFMFCGWIILAPYHIKFRHLSTASECLFSLVNGDDMFVTFSATESDNTVVWYFSQVYLYVFVSLFIYCVLSLFIAVIMDTYETLKEYYEHGFPKTPLQCFVEECNDPISSGLYQRQHTETGGFECSVLSCFSLCCRHDPDKPDEQTGLLTKTI